MKKMHIFCLFFCICCLPTKYTEAQNRLYYTDLEFKAAVDFYLAGQFEESKYKSLELFHKTSPSDTEYFVAVTNLLGNLEFTSGNYDSAVYYFNQNVNTLSQSEKDRVDLSSTLNNLAIVYNYQGNRIKAIDYYEQALSLLGGDPKIQKDNIKYINSIYYNMAVVYSNMKEYEKAKAYYTKSIDIIKHYKLEGLDRTYYNLARLYEKLKEFDRAEMYFINAIALRADKYGEDYYRMAPLYLNYGNLLREKGNYTKALYYLTRGMRIYTASYGKRHPFISEAFVLKAQYHMALQQPDSALVSLQNALIADSKTFHSKEIICNPSYDDCLSAMQLLKALKYKSHILYQSALKKVGNDRHTYLLTSLNTVNEAVKVLKKIKKGYISTENKLLLSNEIKEVFSVAVMVCIQLHRSTGDPKFANYAFMYASAGKANVLFENIANGNELNTIISTPENNKKKALERTINSYKKNIYEEEERAKPDSLKIVAWKGKLFELNSHYENFLEDLRKKYNIPEKNDYMFPTTKRLQERMDEKTSLLEFFITKEPDSENKTLVSFILTEQGLNYTQNEIGTEFFEHLKTFRDHMQFDGEDRSETDPYKSFVEASHNIYKMLIVPIKQYIVGQNLFIVPDDELAYISFDALISEKPDENTKNYASLHYLIKDYCSSYLYSSSMVLFESYEKDHSVKVYAFAPEYADQPDSTNGIIPSRLDQTKKEIEAISQYFECTSYYDQSAREDSFKAVCKKGGIMHIAGHAVSENDQIDFSFISFSDIKNNDEQNGKLYAYEIAETGIRSPLVVLSACNTGDGKLFKGEGMISLSRNFFISGVPAVVNSLWEVNDESGNMIMKGFYKNLSEGLTKKEALRNAKLDYMDLSSPAFVDPKFWAGYIFTGDDSPIVRSIPVPYKIGAIVSVIILLTLGIAKIRKKQKALLTDGL